jgi:predicted DNA-binding protein (UPF0251 family)
MGDSKGQVRQHELTEECPAVSTLREKYYRPLVRLAALLTGDAGSAEAVACDVLTALRPRSPVEPAPSEDVLHYLQGQVLVRSRRIRCRNVATRPDDAAFAELPVVRALQALPRRGREAVVLTHYLELTEQEAALVAGVTPAAMRRLLSQAMRSLADRLSGA